MLLARRMDLCLGSVFMLVDAATYLCSYYMLVRRDDDPTTRHSYMTFVLYGFLQSLIGFIAGLWLSRITTVTEPQTPSVTDEEMTLLQKT
jgi:hypothetical protein